MRHVTLLLLFLLTTPRTGSGQPAGAVSVPRINSSGTGSVRVTPDRATVSIGIQSRGASAAIAAADNAKRQRAIIDTIKAMGVMADQVGTENYSVSPEMQYDPQGRSAPKVVGYVVTNSVRVELKRIDQIAPVIDGSLAKGANQINGVEFSASNEEELRRTALARAVAAAKLDAEAMARAGGGTLGGVIEMSSVAQPVVRPMFSVARESMAAVQSTPIEAGQQVITASVTIVWAFVR